MIDRYVELLGLLRTLGLRILALRILGLNQTQHDKMR